MTEGGGGGITLRPLSLGEIFNGAVTSMRRSPSASLGIAALLAVARLIAAIAVMLERASPVTALRRSWQLVRTSFWRVLGILLLAAAVTCDIRMRREGLDRALRSAPSRPGTGDAGLIWAAPTADPADHGQPGQPAW
jgi:hypothetical protein